MSAPTSFEGGTPLKLLALDGGGIRGLSSLIILKYLMKRVNPRNPPKPCDYFDLIGGTSTGGIIALMLGRFQMTVDQCIEKYLELSSAAFQPKRAKANIFGRAKDVWKTDGAYRGDRLVSEFKTVSEQLEGDADAKMIKVDSPCKVFVCAFTKALNTPVRLRSYVTDVSVDAFSSSNCAIWEAARATSAAATFFDPIQIGRQSFVDGATGFNNPVEVVFEEALSIWPDALSRIQCLVSIGTGIQDLRDFGDNLKEVLETLSSIATETETTEKRFFGNHERLGLSDRYFRFNVDKGMGGIGLDEHNKLDRLEAATQIYLDDLRVKGAIEKLVKSSAPVNASVKGHVKDVYLSWLPYFDPLEYHNIARGFRTSDSTGHWFMDSEFQKFKMKDRSILWLCAKAGAGKSVLASKIIDEIEQQKLGTLAFFYFSYNSKDRQGISQDMRHFRYSLLIQLVRQHIREDPSQFNQYFVPLGFQQLYHANYPSRNPKNDEVDAAILRLLDISEETFIVVDALDEYTSPTEVLCFLDKLCKLARRRVHILVTSRREEDIELSVGDISASKQIVPFDSTKVNLDIEVHLRHCMSSHPYQKWTAELKERVVKYLSERADGVFRWADLQFQELGKKAREKDVVKALSKLPKTLGETYQRILQRIDEDYADEAFAILQWLAYSCQPLSLEQAAEIAAFETRRKDPVETDSRDYTVSFVPMNRFDNSSWVRRILSGLVIVTGHDKHTSHLNHIDEVPVVALQDLDVGITTSSSTSSLVINPRTKGSDQEQIILLAHFSVKEYLESAEVCPAHFRLNITAGHWYIFKSSLAYIGHYDKNCFMDADSAVHPLLLYAWLNWAFHANDFISSMGLDDIENLLDESIDPAGTAYQLSISAISSQLKWYLNSCGPENFVPTQTLFRAVDRQIKRLGYQDYFSHYPRFSHDRVRSAPMDLWNAAYGGRKEYVKLLLDAGVNVNMTLYNDPIGKHMRRGWTPLHSAAESGHVDVVNLLIKRGAEVDAEFLTSHTQIEYISLRQLAEKYRHAQFAQVFPEAVSRIERGITPLAVATKAGHECVVRILLESGADVDYRVSCAEWRELSQHGQRTQEGDDVRGWIEEEEEESLLHFVIPPEILTGDLIGEWRASLTLGSELVPR